MSSTAASPAAAPEARSDAGRRGDLDEKEKGAGLKGKILYLVTEDWYFCSHRLALARAARDAGLEVVVATRVDAHAGAIRAEGFKLVPIRLRRRETRPWRELATLWELLGLYRRERPDVAHHVAMKPVLYGSVAARLARVPVVINALAGLGYLFASTRAPARVLRPAVGRLLGWLLRLPGGHAIVQNPDDEQALRRLGVPAARIHVIRGSGVDLVRFAPVPEPRGQIVVAMVSRMLWDKGVWELVEAARILRESQPGVRIWLVGPPDPENPASVPEPQLRGWQAEGVVWWTRSSERIPSVWARAHIGVLPSYREGLPKSLLEAAACGRPLVATDVPGCREIVRAGETGLIVPARDARALADAIGRLADDRSLRRRLGTEARRLVEREFSEVRIVGETLSLYRSLAFE